jgi:hypothetical protein
MSKIFDSKRGWATDIDFLISIETLGSMCLKIRDTSLPNNAGYRFITFKTEEERAEFFDMFMRYKNGELEWTTI